MSLPLHRHHHFHHCQPYHKDSNNRHCQQPSTSTNPPTLHLFALIAPYHCHRTPPLLSPDSHPIVFPTKKKRKTTFGICWLDLKLLHLFVKRNGDFCKLHLPQKRLCR
ncbi:hypothetical protein Pint_25571 [Pistacia integerrima]|uniref:Uncharacterized protein n=1 Tax=Pistacia integerrima TaxID=434235 RepID=A0ACC0YFQ8_9ROSI|nr:hypothetical protein Pint_25571 [Pistacia integerrima]